VLNLLGIGTQGDRNQLITSLDLLPKTHQAPFGSKCGSFLVCSANLLPITLKFGEVTGHVDGMRDAQTVPATASERNRIGNSSLSPVREPKHPEDDGTIDQQIWAGVVEVFSRDVGP
jgi:hypothetical protein